MVLPQDGLADHCHHRRRTPCLPNPSARLLAVPAATRPTRGNRTPIGGPTSSTWACSISIRPSPTRWARTSTRSEEHTSELQSLMRLSYAVFCLKQKNKTTKQKTH